MARRPGLGRARPAARRAQGFVFESTPRFDVNIVIEPSGDLLITETIVQEFGSTPRHGIFRFIPNRLRYDDEFDRVYPIELLSVTASPNTPTDVETKDENGNFSIRIGDPDTDDHRPPHLRDRLSGPGRDERVRRPRRAVLERDRRPVGAVDRRDERPRERPRRHHARGLLPGHVRVDDPVRPGPDHQEGRRGLLAVEPARVPGDVGRGRACRRGPSRAPRRSWTSAGASTRRSAGRRSPWAGGWGCSSWWSGGSGS